MKHIKPYKIFENSQELQHPGFPTTEEEIHELCKKYKIENYTINDDLSIDVDGEVDLKNNELIYLPLNFNYVSGNFSCHRNELISLKGAPHTVGRGFYCYQNKLNSLEGAPHTIDGHFFCSDNKLETLKGVPHTIGGNFSCSDNKLKTLKGGSHTIGGFFDCSFNNLISLEGAPHKVGGIFSCFNNNIMSLKYLPNGIDYNSGYTNFYSNPIHSVVNTFIEEYNAEDLVKEFNDYDIVRSDEVVLSRLEVFISDFDLDMPNLDEVRKHYKIV